MPGPTRHVGQGTELNSSGDMSFILIVTLCNKKHLGDCSNWHTPRNRLRHPRSSRNQRWGRSEEGGPCQDCKVWTDEEIAARRQKEWVLMSGPEDAYYHVNCLNMKLKPSESYTLTLRIGAVDPNTPRINLIPTLEGGQLDLP